MSVRLTEPVELVLGDRTFHLRYTMKTFRAVKKLTGISLFESFTKLNEDVLPEIIHAGLVESGVSVDEIADLIDLPSLQYVVKQMLTAMGVKAEDTPPLGQ